MPKRYSPEIRRRVLELLKAGGKVAEVPADLGVSTRTIYNWRRLDRQRSQPGSEQHRSCRADRRASADRAARVGARGRSAGRGAAPRGGAPKGRSR